MNAQLISPNSSSLSYSSDKAKGVYRENLIDSIETLISEDSNILILEGERGIGKTTILAQLAQKNPFDSITYFANKLNKLSFNPNFLIEDLGRQLYFLINNVQPIDDYKFTQSDLNALHLSLIKVLKRRRKKLLFLLDGLDQIPSTDLEQLKTILEILPWDNSNTCIILSGDSKVIKTIYPEVIEKKSTSVRALQFAIEETKIFFGSLINNEEDLREIHKTWKGHPESLGNIKRLLNRDLTIKQFLKEDITEKNRLLDIEWSKSIKYINHEWQYLALAVICYDFNINTVERISVIINIEEQIFKGWISNVSFIDINSEGVSFISTSFKDFASGKLRKYEKEASQMMIEFYLKNTDENSIVNLTSYYEKNMAYSKVVDLLSSESLAQLITKSKSFSEIKNLISSGYKASLSLPNSYDNVFKFSLYKSFLLELQNTDSREAEIQACVSLKEYDKALSIVSSAVLKEDRFKMLVIYAKECRSRKASIDPIILQELSDSFETIDLDYIKENVIEIATKLTHVQPSLAIKLLERASDGADNNPSIEWLLAYLSAVANKQETKSTQAVEDMSSDNTEESFINGFFSSLSNQTEKITISEVKNDLSKFKTGSDRLYLVRSWLRSNAKNKNAYSVMNLGLDFLLEDSSNNKPTTTTLLDVSSPLIALEDEADIRKYVGRISSLLQTITTPSTDWIKLQILLAEAELRFSLVQANTRLSNLFKFINEHEDVTIRAEAYARCWSLLKRVYSSGFQEEDLVYRVTEIKSYLVKELDAIIQSTAQQYRELKSTVEELSLIDISFTADLIQRVNTQDRRNWCYISCVKSYTTKPLNEWDTLALKRIIAQVKEEEDLGKLILEVVNSAYKKKEASIDGRHNFIELLYILDLISDDELKCYISVKSIAILLRQPKKLIGLTKNYNSIINKLKKFLFECWTKINNPWIKINVGYTICADVADFDLDLAKEYYYVSKSLEDSVFVDNISYASTFIQSIMIAVETCVGAFKFGMEPKIDEIGYLVENINSSLDQLLIWSELTVKLYLANAKSHAETIATNKIVPIIEVYSNDKKDKDYLDSLILYSASALYLTQPANVMLLLEKISPSHKEAAVVNIINVLVNNVYERDPYESQKGFNDIKYQQVSEIVHLLKFIEDDTLLFTLVKKLSYTVKEYPLNLTREQKASVKQSIKDIISEKLPSKIGGIKHEGYLIVTESFLSHFDSVHQENEYNKFITNLRDRAALITNVADRSFVYSVLALECNGKAKKIKQELLESAFESADLIPSNRERFDRYENALNTAKDVAPEIFVSKIRAINTELFEIDSKDLFSTHRRLIDLAFEHDKVLAEKLISVLDTDPARKRMTFPVAKHLDKVKQEEEAIDDYAKFSKLKNREQIRKVALRNLGQMNSGKRVPKSIEQSILLLKPASKIPFSYAMSVFELFLQNTFKKIGTIAKNKGLVQSLQDNALSNARLTYNIVCSLSLKKSYIPTNFALKNPEHTFVVKPGQRQAALEYINEFASTISSEELFVIDPYLSENDIQFIRGLVENCPNSHITLMTSLEGSKNKVSIDKPSFISAWRSISADPLPNMTIIRVNKVDQTSPFHDRWIIPGDMLSGLRVGSSINSIGGGKLSEISMMEPTEVESIYNTIIEPFANQRVKVYGKDKMRYESFDL